ncbi:MAG: putative bifunctional diguanylate cyclase/phosphodiesterase [Janthinobacterium lividum]
MDERHGRQARAGMLRETLEVANYSAVTHLAVSLVLGFVFWDHAPNGYLIVLNVTMLLIVSVTMGCTIVMREKIRGVTSETTVRHGFLLAKVVALLYGLLWSSMPALLIPSPESGYQLVAVATTAGLISDAYVVGPIFAVSNLLIIPIVFGAFVGLYQCAYPFGLYISVLLAVYAAFVLLSTRRMSELSYQRLLDRVMVQSQTETIGLLLNDFEESAADWLWETDAAGTLLHAPVRMATAMSISADQILGMTIAELLRNYACNQDGCNGIAKVLAALARKAPFHDQVVRLKTVQGTRWWRLNGKPSLDGGDVFAGFRGVGADITQTHEADARISYLAGHDTLTGLANRISFQNRMERVCGQAVSSEVSTALLCLDLDGFKAINDGHGHPIGDLLLKSVAERLRSLCDGRNEVYRLGGDEFAILHECNDSLAAGVLATAAIAQIGMPHVIQGMNLGVGVSIGITHTSPGIHDPATLLSQADLALYSAKASGKGQWQTYDPALEAKVHRRHRLDVGMRAALVRGELQLHYQPLVNITTEQIVGVEALLRWHSPEEGWISPAELIPIAESTGFIADIGRWALRKACTDALAWPGLTVAVNISSAHFRSDTFCDEVDAALAETGLAPSRLEIEITESMFLEGGEEVATNMRRLRARGIRLSLDDFGTGYSSLSYLSKFRFDKLKIDRSFVQDLHQRRDTLAIFDAINGMANALQMSVTVEGVEQEQQMSVLRERFVGTIQGYYFSKPKTADQVTNDIRAASWNVAIEQKLG